jgi:hypothetical protein
MLFLFVVICSAILLLPVTTGSAWVPSKHLSEWYKPIDLCMFNTATNFSDRMQDVAKTCNGGKKALLHCRIGGVFQKSNMCGSQWSTPLNTKEHLMMSYSEELDYPGKHILRSLFEAISSRNGTLLMLGDSQMSSFELNMDCDLINEGLQPFSFERVSEVKMSGKPSVPMRTVAGKEFTIENIKKVIEHDYQLRDYILLVINSGSHFNDEPRFINFVHKFLPQLNDLARERGDSLDVAWMETPPQHFNTSNGYWGGKSTPCVPITNRSQRADWRNFHIHDVKGRQGLGSVKILKMRDLMVDLHKEHRRGDYQDCTHYCSWPMLYLSTYQQMLNMVSKNHPSL